MSTQVIPRHVPGYLEPSDDLRQQLHNARETVNIERDNAAVGWPGPSQAQLAEVDRLEAEVDRLEAEYERVTGHASPRSTFELLNTPLGAVQP